MTLVNSSIVFFAAAVVAVPLFQRFKLGAILGYLIAGVFIGPSVMGFIDHPETILHFAEIGVVLMLFVIGLELEPEKLLRMRNQILVTGGGQLLVTAALIGSGVLILTTYGFNASLVIGLALALSSTAFAIQLMNEQRILQTAPGQSGFAILLMQDLAVIPILLVVEYLSTSENTNAPPWWLAIIAIVGVLVAGRFFLNPFLRLVSRYGSQEVMTAASLLIVLATATGFQAAGLSMGMGAFIAGMLLANSSFRHQLETEIEPFQGLLLGLFFMAIGMNLDLSLLQSQPVLIVSCAIGLIVLKALVILGVMRLSRHSATDGMRIGLMLSQGGEFAFVVMTQATANQVLDPLLASQITLIVGVSMALTSPVVILYSMWFNSRECPPVYDTVTDNDEPQVIIAGFGRFGQITGRILHANRIAFTALDKDAEHIEFVKRFGNKVFYGDATRLDLLKVAGIEHAKVLLIAVDNEKEGLKIAELVHEEFPDVKIVARARNRNGYREFYELGASASIRELFAGSLEAAESVLKEYGYSETEASRYIQLFAKHDIRRLDETKQGTGDMSAMVASAKKGREELESLFSQDQ